MIKYNREPSRVIKTKEGEIACFDNSENDNIDITTVDSFGEEWSKFDSFDETTIESIGDEYFDVVDESCMGEDKIALDVGCGSGRWSLYAANKFGFVEGIDPSSAVFVANKATEKKKNIRITKAGVDQIPFANESFDFVFSLGVLHHIPDTAGAMQKSVEKLKKGGHFLVYLYYSLDNRGAFFKALFWLSNLIRNLIFRLPRFLKKLVCDIIAFLVYLPFVLLASLLKFMGVGLWKKIPLSYYVGKSLFVIRNDALDRFGTPLEQRFSRKQIEEMMKSCGLSDIKFSENTPYWHAIGKKK